MQSGVSVSVIVATAPGRKLQLERCLAGYRACGGELELIPVPASSAEASWAAGAALAGGNYLEVVSALDHPAAEDAAFGRAVKQRCTNGGGWLGWVVEVTDLAELESRLGRRAVPGHRRRPDGYDLRWRQLGVYDLMADPQLPFFIHWESDSAEHPGRRSSSQLRLVKLEIAGEPDTVGNWLGSSNGHPLDDIDVEWVDPREDEIGLVAAHFSTPQGIVRVD